MNILGVAFLADASAALLVDGKLVAAVSEERLNRVKQWCGIPHGAIREVLRLGGLRLDDIDLIATHGVTADIRPDTAHFEDKKKKIMASRLPDEVRDRQLDYLQKRLEHEHFVCSERTPRFLKEISALGRPLRVVGHHEAHAASAYFGSGWDESLILTLDGWGEDGSSTLWSGKAGAMKLLRRTPTIDSLGYFYGSVTKALGFVPERHEGKVLGLAAYCQKSASYATLKTLVDYDASTGRFVGRMEGGIYVPKLDNPALGEFVKGFSREDVSSAVQRRLEEVVTACVADLDGAATRLAVAGGVFANVKLNQRIQEMSNVSEMFVFPNMGDGGLSVGAACLVHSRETGQRPGPTETMYLGPEYSEHEIGETLVKSGLRYTRETDIHETTAKLLAQDQVVARFNGRMEFGPRALGHRSILYPAKDPAVNQWLNHRLNRSEFMPFAPATLAEHAERCYVNYKPGQKAASYMTMTYDCTPEMRRVSPASIHVDGTARPQVVHSDESPDFHRLLSAYFKRTGIPSVINTSFNMHEEPIVCSVDDALRAFLDGGLPYLAAGPFLVQAPEATLQ